MSGGAALPQGLRAFALGRIVGSVLALLWLLLLARHLPLPQVGVYFACLALFETLQMGSGLGVHFYAERRLPGLWALGARQACARLIALLLAWRGATLGMAVLAASVAMPEVASLLGWPAEAPGGPVLAAWMLVCGMARLQEVVLECLLQQGFSQLLNALRNLLRLLLVWVLLEGPMTVDASVVLAVECLVGVLYLLAGCVWVGLRWTRLRGDSAAEPAERLAQDLRFAWQGWLALLVVQVSGADAVRLAVSAAAGPQGLAIYGLTLSLVDMVCRHLPAALLYGYVRTWFTIREGAGRPRREFLRVGRVLIRLSGLAAMLAWALGLLWGADLAALVAPAMDARVLQVMWIAWAPLLLLQGVRLMLSLICHLDGNNQAVLHANLATLPVPWVVLLAVEAFGVRGAVCGPLLLEFILIAALGYGVRPRWVRLFGRARLWLRALAVVVAGLLVAWGVAGLLPIMSAGHMLVLFGVAVGLLAWLWLRPERDERTLLRGLFGLP